METFLETPVEVQEIDAEIRNKFKFEWLSVKDCNGDFFSDYIRKPKVPGQVFCVHCKYYINYGSGGKRCLASHAKSTKHVSMRNLKITNQKLPSSFQSRKDNCEEQASTLPYGVASNVFATVSANITSTPNQPNVSSLDRRSNAEATLLSFVAEHNLPLTMIPALIDLAQELARDPGALSALKMSRPCGTYKMTDGLAPALKKKLIYDLQRYPFSINLDECTNNANKRILTILVSYYSEEEERVIVQHYASTELIFVNAESVFQTVTEAFEKDEIPMGNLVSSLSDSAGYMRGCKNGFETLLRIRAPHLLNIGGDTCHDVHNIVKHFCNHFGRHIESLLDDIHVDLKYSRDIEDYLRDMCSLKGVGFLKPRQRVPHRWLSVYDCALPIQQMFSALTLLYWAWFPEEQQTHELVTMYKSLLPESDNGKKLIKSIHTECRLKSLTAEGKERKKRIVRKLLSDRVKTQLLINMYISCLNKFKAYIETFQKKEPMVHKLSDKQDELMDWFFQCFLRSEEVKKYEKDLRKMNVKNTSLHLPLSKFYVGLNTNEVLTTLAKKDKVRVEFLEAMRIAYVSTAEYMQKKLCSSDVMKQMSALDPKVCGYTVTHVELLKMLLKHFPNALSKEEKAEYEREVRAMQVDRHLPKVEDDMRLDEWWTLIFRSEKYPCLSKIVKRCLSVFTSPQVEQSFSQMNEMVTATTNRLETKTFSALQTVKYYLKSKQKPQKAKGKKSAEGAGTSRLKEKDSVSLRIFHRENVRKDPVDSLICRHLQKAHLSYKEYLSDKSMQKKKDKEKSKCKANPSKTTSEKRKRQNAGPSVPAPPRKKAVQTKTIN